MFLRTPEYLIINKKPKLQERTYSEGIITIYRLFTASQLQMNAAMMTCDTVHARCQQTKQTTNDRYDRVMLPARISMRYEL